MAVSASFSLYIHPFLSLSLGLLLSLCLCFSFLSYSPSISIFLLLPLFVVSLFLCIQSLCPISPDFFPEYVALVFYLTGSSGLSFQLDICLLLTVLLDLPAVESSPDTLIFLFSLVYRCSFDSQVFLGLAWEPGSLPSFFHCL